MPLIQNQAAFGVMIADSKNFSTGGFDCELVILKNAFARSRSVIYNFLSFVAATFVKTAAF